ncbi:uncharacterized protein LOC103483558 isoform X1 [Cucumis melo]|uniref:Uncharacterized protein LOC103483558 isoform X1 n=1 Tax=Cucumis melo TaxID=3656 RepID=A0A1S3AWG0_CUCME|nr:uncharacterized protein LOC103483558 isoform X1 [Cucumis melo]
MDGDSKDVNGCKEKTMDSAAAGEVGDHSNGEEYSESNALLPPRRGGMSRKLNKPRMKVRWNDSNGNNLAEILEFQPRLLCYYNDCQRRSKIGSMICCYTTQFLAMCPSDILYCFGFFKLVR